jgi:hypothetical protein
MVPVLDEYIIAKSLIDVALENRISGGRNPEITANQYSRRSVPK